LGEVIVGGLPAHAHQSGNRDGQKYWPNNRLQIGEAPRERIDWHDFPITGGRQRGEAEIQRDRDFLLIGRFLDEAAKLYADALQSKREYAAALMIGIYSLTNRIRLSSSARVVESADAVARIIMDAYLSPNMTLQEVRNRWVERHIDPLRDFSEACREELRIFGKF